MTIDIDSLMSKPFLELTSAERKLLSKIKRLKNKKEAAVSKIVNLCDHNEKLQSLITANLTKQRELDALVSNLIEEISTLVNSWNSSGTSSGVTATTEENQLSGN